MSSDETKNPVPLAFGEPKNSFAIPLTEPAKEDIPKGEMVLLDMDGKAVPDPQSMTIKPGVFLPYDINRAIEVVLKHDDKLREMVRKLQRLRASSPEDIRAAGYTQLDVDSQNIGSVTCEAKKHGYVVVYGQGASYAAALNNIREQIGIPTIPLGE